MQQNQKEEKKTPPNDLLRYSGMGIKMAVVIAVAVFGGIKLDEMRDAEFPLWTLTLSLCGVAAAIYFVIKDTQPQK